jgi:ABC-2 type transport system ATP-binding protein
LGTKAELTRQVGQNDALLLHLAEGDDPQPLLKVLKTLPGIIRAEETDHTITLLAPEAEEIMAPVITAANAANVKIRSVEIKEPNLEAVFLHLTGRALRD